MKRWLAGTVALAVAGAVVVVGCSSGSSSGSGKRTSRGIISGFGSVIVNGVHYDGSGAGVMIDGVSAAESDLRVGMEVTIRSDGTVASSISAADTLEGPVASVDAAAGSLSVLGQTVQTDTLTNFEQVAGLAGISAGMIVEVSGLVDNAGVIHATRVELKTATPSASTPIEVKGTVTLLDPVQKTFKVNFLNVDYSGAALNDFPASGMAEGQSVEVKGTVGTFDAGTSTLAASSVEMQQGLGANEGEQVEIEGYVANYVSDADFTVNGVSVDASGVAASGIADGVLIEVEGSVNASGVLIASRVSVEQESDIVLEGDVTAVDASGAVVSLLTNTASITATTELVDSSAAQVRLFSLADVVSGDHLEVTGYQNANGDLIATKVERLDPSARTVIQGKVTSKTSLSLAILGVTVSVDGATLCRDRNDVAMATADFFSAVTANTTIVKAQWDSLGGSGLSTPVTELELESTP